MCRSSAKIVENVIKLTLVNIYLHLSNMTGLDKHNVMTLINVPIITHLNAVVNQTVRAMLDGKSRHYVHNLLSIHIHMCIQFRFMKRYCHYFIPQALALKKIIY